MKRLIIIFLSFISLIFTTASCDKLSGDSDSDTAIITDTKLIGIWSVSKYEALDKSGNVFDTVTNLDVIAQTYWKFVFDASCNMQCWYNVTAGQCVVTTYAYFSSTGDLLFGVNGEATVQTLTEAGSLVFESTSFAPYDWYDTTTGLIKTGISSVRVTCTKVTEE